MKRGSTAEGEMGGEKGSKQGKKELGGRRVARERGMEEERKIEPNVHL